jgi:DNA polymerase III subunit alpha
VRIRPGNLDLYLEIVGLEQVRRAIYKAGASLRVRYDDRLIPELEHAVGAGQVRLLGQRGATTRVDAGSPTTGSPLPTTQPALARPPTLETELDDSPLDDSDDL